MFEKATLPGSIQNASGAHLVQCKKSASSANLSAALARPAPAAAPASATQSSTAGCGKGNKSEK